MRIPREIFSRTLKQILLPTLLKALCFIYCHKLCSLMIRNVLGSAHKSGVFLLGVAKIVLRLLSQKEQRNYF